MERNQDPNFAPLKVFDIIGYAKTATSPAEAEPLKYLKPEDTKIMNRNSLLPISRKILEENKNFKSPIECKFNLSGKVVKEKMIQVLEKLYNEIFKDALDNIEDYEVQAVAATYMAIAMRLYKTHLADDAYRKMIRTVMETEMKPSNTKKMSH